MMTTFKTLWNAVGGLGEPSKMPGYAWGIPARHCITGGKLRAHKVDGPCTHCYCLRHRYLWDEVHAALQRRLDIYNASPLAWVNNMAALLNRPRVAKHRHFRWFDSGDLQSVEMMLSICSIAEKTPKLKHYLPTKEAHWILPKVVIPKNLAVRYSLPLFDQQVPKYKGGLFLICSVVTDGSETCPAHEQGNHCGDCRRCWDRRVKHVTYRRH